jgi:hypothetical protein
MSKNLEQIKRENVLKMVEGDMPYDRQTYVNHAKFYLSRTIEDILMSGKFLLVIKEREGYGEFVKICEGDIGIPHSTAYRFMNAALKAQKYPKLDFSQLGKVSHVYALIEAPDEELKELEKHGVMAGKSMDDLQGMSVKEMRNLIRKLKADAEGVIGKEVKKLEDKNRELADEIRRLNARIPIPEGKKFADAWATGEQLIEEATEIFFTLTSDR